MKDLVSVIIPVYNGEATIEKAVRSVMACMQSVDMEIVIVNDGSSDSSLSIIKRLAKDDSRIVVVDQKNMGVAGARNTGLRAARGNFITWCDADDWVEPDWIDCMYSRIKEYHADVVCFRAKLEGPGMRNNPYNPSEIIEWNRDQAIEAFLEHKRLNGCLPMKMFRTNVLSGISFDCSQRYWEDLAFVWKVLKKVDKVIRCNEGKYHYVMNPQSLCHEHMSKQRMCDSMMVWDNIVDDCSKEPFSSHQQSASHHRIRVYIDEMMLMFKDGYHDRDAEKKIQTLLRKEGIKGLSSKDKLFVALAIVCMPLSRLVASFLYKVRK